MKLRERRVLSTIFLNCSFCFLFCSVVSCSYSIPNLAESDFTKLIIKEESVDNVMNRLQRTFNLKNNVSEEDFEREMKKILKEELIVDKDSLIYKELEKLNKLEEFNQQYVDETYDSLLEEIKNENLTLRHWVGIFKAHSYITALRKLQALSLNLLAITDLTIQLAPAIVLFIKNGDAQALADAFSTFDGSFTSVTKWLFVKGIEDLRNWKVKTKCKSNFHVWGQNL